VHVIDDVVAAGAWLVTTDGRYIVWAAWPTPGATHSVLKSLDVESGIVQEIYRSPDHGAVLASLAVFGDRVAFAEITGTPEGGTWALKLLARPGTEPLVIDRNDLPFGSPGILPMTALDGRYLVWATTHAADPEATSSERGQCELLLYDIELASRETLRSSPCSEVEYRYPSIDAGRLVFATVEYRADGRDDRHVYLVDLADPARQITRLDNDAAATMPVIVGDTVYWKTAPQPFGSTNYGNLERMRLPAGRPERLPFFARERQTLSHPSAGPRYVTAELIGPTRVAAFDTERWETIVVEQVDELGPEWFSDPRIAGDLMVWLYARDVSGAGREIHWTRLGDDR
jgi:hypothetical protein